MSEAKHSPLPWVPFVIDGKCAALMPAGLPGDVCTFEQTPSDADAALIVRATSLHHELVAALGGIVKHMDSNGMGNWPVAKKARAALQKAKQGDKP